MSPAAIVSAMHQHIVFGTRQWDIGIPDVKEKDTPSRKEDKSWAHGYVKPLRGRSTSRPATASKPRIEGLGVQEFSIAAEA